MQNDSRATSLSEAQAAIENIPEKSEEGVKEDNIAFSNLIDAVLALKRAAPSDSDERRQLEEIHENVVEAYTNIRERDGGYVDGEERAQYVEELESVRDSLDSEGE